MKGNFILKKKKKNLDFFELSEISSYATLLWTEFYRKPSRLGALYQYMDTDMGTDESVCSNCNGFWYVHFPLTVQGTVTITVNGFDDNTRHEGPT